MEQETVIEQVCVDCGTVYGTIDGRGKTGQSHGVCPSCEPAFRKRYGMEARECSPS